MNNIFLYIIVFALLITGCAQVGSLTGGKKDETPPILLKSTPEEQTLNFKGNKLVFKFDEYFILDNLNSVFICSPPLLKKPDFKIKGKKFIVKFNEKLKDSATYMLWFADALKDNNESNPYKDFKYIFSTGNEIDTMEVSGTIKDAYTNNAEEEMYVLLYKNNNDSAPINQKPYYIARTDTSGKFTIDFIKNGSYKMFALKDLDANLQFSLPNEKIAFIDSLIIPKVETETIIDTFKAGSVIHIGNETVGDTLVNDTVILHKEFKYYPNNITLFSFEEDNSKQYVSNSSRDFFGKCKFEFNKIPNDVLITPYNFSFNKNGFIEEKTDTGKSITYWIKEKQIYQKDTLSFLVSYPNIDSIGITETETDTILLPFNFEKDTIQKFVEFIDLKEKQDSFKNFIIETNYPINKYDTRKIKLFEVFDTLVADIRKQKLIKAQRISPKQLIFELKRPFVNKFNIELLNSDTSENWCEKTYLKDSTKIICNINNSNISQKDTLKIKLNYDNNYFKKQIQNFTDTISLPLLKQGVISVKRPASDTIKITFKKKYLTKTTIQVEGEDVTNWYNVLPSEEDNILTLKIKNKKIETKDTIILNMKISDFENTKGDKIEFEYSKRAIFKFNKQKIKKYAREERNRFYFIFSKPLENNISINLLNFNQKHTWFNKEINKNKDTVVYTITNRTITNLDTIKLEIKYNIKNKFEEIELITDTVNFVYKRVRERRKRTSKRNKKSSKKQTNTKNNTNNEKLTEIGIDIPIEYSIFKDSTSYRKLNISYPWKQTKTYLLKMDSMAVSDIYNNYSKSTENKFVIRDSTSYCQLKISIININGISKNNFLQKKDTSNIDTLITPNLKKGQILLTLYDEKNNIVKTNITSSDTSFTISKLIPGKYSLKIIYDENMNKKWDTGKYLKHLQPERVIIYSEEINLSKGELKELCCKL